MPIQPSAPPLTGPTLSAQHWRDLAFLHWPIEPTAIASLFPAGTRPDVIDGSSYVGLVPFRMRGAGPSRLPVPYLGDFCETNVRLYSVDADDRHGIVFLTLDAARLATVLLARLSLGLPYAWSSMRAEAMPVHGGGGTPAYRSRRRWPSTTTISRPHCNLSLNVGEPVQPTPLEVWLTARWGLHTRVAGRTVWVPNEHPAWPLHSAELASFDSDLVQSCGLVVDDAAMLRPLWSPGVRTTFGRPRLVRGAV
jgi:uncharacterized protein YqjF (DUF2071 family)